jgi:hypothetical protein
MEARRFLNTVIHTKILLRGTPFHSEYSSCRSSDLRRENKKKLLASTSESSLLRLCLPVIIVIFAVE